MSVDNLVVGAIPYDNISRVRTSILRASSLGADAVELRLDYWIHDSIPPFHEEVRLAKDYGLKVIITVRDPREGGQWNPPWKWEALKLANDMNVMCDVEARILASRNWHVPCKKTITSMHFFESISKKDLKDIEEYSSTAVNSGTYAFKVAAKVDDINSLKMIMDSIKHPRAAFMPMGEGTERLRLISMIMGSFLSYGALGKITAPGQVSLTSLVLLKRSLQSI